jgi:site-specific DNA-methyltransferase (adenine-specific)
MIERGNGWEMHLGEAFDWMLQREDDSIDALLCDPPYSSGGFVRGDRTASTRTKYVNSDVNHDLADFDGDNRDQRGFLAWCTLWLTEGVRIVRAGHPVGVFCDWRQMPLMTDAVQAGGFVWRGVWVWTKDNNSRPQMGRFRSDAEFLVWGSRGPMRSGEDVGCLPGTCTVPPVPGADRVHITQKPVEVMERVVRICPPEGLVLDPFAGSGSTGVACLRAGRRFVGVERSAANFAIACDRLRAEEQGSTLAARRAGQMPLLGGVT